MTASLAVVIFFRILRLASVMAASGDYINPDNHPAYGADDHAERPRMQIIVTKPPKPETDKYPPQKFAQSLIALTGAHLIFSMIRGLDGLSGLYGLELPVDGLKFLQSGVLLIGVIGHVQNFAGG